MSSEHLVHDVEKGHSIVVVREQPHKDTHWKCLSIFSFVLLIGATVVFTLLQFGAFKQPGDEMDRESYSGLPDTLRVQAVASGKPAIHAIGLSVSDKQLIWTAGVAGTLSKNGMKLDENGVSVVVPSTGLYFVYSQLSFHSGSCPENSLVINHKVLWQSSDFNTEMTLLNAIKTPCKGREASKSIWFEPIYQGAVFELKKGDRLSSTTDSPEYLDLSEHEQVYFGIIAM